MKKIKSEALLDLSYDNFKVQSGAVNPVEQAKMLSGSQFIDKINEDIRGIKYTKDTPKAQTNTFH